MCARYICPHCHESLNPHAMERAFSELAEYRICPVCDEAVFFALLDAPSIPSWLQRATNGLKSVREPGRSATSAASGHTELG